MIFCWVCILEFLKNKLLCYKSLDPDNNLSTIKTKKSSEATIFRKSLLLQCFLYNHSNIKKNRKVFWNEKKAKIQNASYSQNRLIFQKGRLFWECSQASKPFMLYWPLKEENKHYSRLNDTILNAFWSIENPDPHTETDRRKGIRQLKYSFISTMKELECVTLFKETMIWPTALLNIGLNKKHISVGFCHGVSLY